jgi:hypothetical protein
MGIRERILARPELDDLRAARDITELAVRLNEECQPAQIPQQVTAHVLLRYVDHQDVFLDLLTEAAAGQDVSSRAAALLSSDGVTVFIPGFEPPYVNQLEVAEAMYNPDGSEK